MLDWLNRQTCAQRSESRSDVLRRARQWAFLALGGLLLLPQLVLTLLMLGYGLPANSSIGIIGGADGPTAIFITAGFPWGLLFAILGCIALVILGIIMGRRPD